MSADLEECIHGLGPVSACVICNGRERREQKAAARVVHWFEARYNGRLYCGCVCSVGDLIGRREDDEFICETHGQSPSTED